MTPELSRQIEAAKARWMTGGSAEAACPEAWRAALGTTPDLALLALIGQFTHLATQPALAGAPRARALLPPLALPPLAADLRPELRRLLAQKSVPEIEVIRLIATRGHAVSPLDWMPRAQDSGLPDVYTPWLDWLADGPARTEPAPTAETWDQWSPQARLAHVEQLRRTAPGAARALVEAVAPGLAAEPRHRLISVLAVGLSAADLPFLTTLQADKSARVQALAASLRARLGVAGADAAACEEMAAFFATTRTGLLSRRTVAAARPLKTAAQRRRRAELAEQLPLAALAGALGLSGAELIAAWDFGDATEEIGAMVAGTGSDAEVQAFLARGIAAPGVFNLTGPLIDRLAVDQRRALAPQIIARDSASFAVTARLLSSAPGTLARAAILGSGAFRDFETALQAQNDPPPPILGTGFVNLGLIADRQAAQALLDRFIGAGLIFADPRLSLLRLNAAL